MLEYEIQVFPAMEGAFIDLDKVPDQVFANRLVGDGVAIDPYNNLVYAPLSGIIKSIHKSKHAITITSQYGFDILIHIGIDTVTLSGIGFKPLVNEGDEVQVHDKIMELDLDYLSLNAKTLISPMLVCDIFNSGIKVKLINQLHHEVSLDKPVFIVTKLSTSDKQIESHINDDVVSATSGLITIINPTGVHARPAALLAQHASEFNGELYVEKAGEKVNLKSITAILGLSIQCGDKVKIFANGTDAGVIVQSITELLSTLNEVNTDNQTIIQACLQLNHNTIGGSQIYRGTVASTGFAIGKIIKLNQLNFTYLEHCDNIENEIQKFNLAVKVANSHLDGLIGLSINDIEHNGILVAHAMILNDPEILAEIINKIKSKQSAAKALSDTINKHCEILNNTGVELLQQRQIDLKDVCVQVLKHLDDVKFATPIFEPNSIVLSEELTPSDIIHLDKNVIGLLSINGGITSHVSILAKSKGIPLLINFEPSLFDNIVSSNKTVLLDASAGILNLDPSFDELETIKQQIMKQQLSQEKALKDASKQCFINNINIECCANIANRQDVINAIKNGADGVGLFRTEFLFLEQDSSPDIATQLKVYQNIANQLGDKPFILRTLDAGGEKNIAYLNIPHETNPLLGVRGIRLCLDNIELFKMQLSAILQTKYNNIKIMLPMVSSLDEYRSSKSIITQLQAEFEIKTNIELGIMIEIPSAALMADIFAKEVDFFSIGTNDLTQYTLAIDRENINLTELFDHLNPAVLRNIKLVVDGAKKYNRPVSVCGMMASEMIAIPVLIGLGILQLSMDLNSIAANKAFIRKLDIKQCEDIADQCLYLSTSKDVRNLLLKNFGNLI